MSPDGSKLVYVGESGRLLVKSRDQLEPVELTGTEGAFNPVFSRDGTQIGFMRGAAGNSEIKVTPLAGGPPTTVTSTGVGGPGVAFGYDGYIYFDASGVGPLMRVRATGDGQEAVSVRDTVNGELQHNWPDPLPNARGVLMVIDSYPFLITFDGSSTDSMRYSAVPSLPALAISGPNCVPVSAS